MAGSTSGDYVDKLFEGISFEGISLFDGMSSEQRSQSGDSLAEWRSSEQVENGTPSTSPPYWDTDDDDDCGPKPSELYGKFTWKIENFSQISKRELRSNAFEVGGYKWYILIYPQGCDVCNHLSLFLCVANHDKLLPGWSHFAQFTIAVVNKDPKKSKYSDTLHRFWKKEHDWGWKKFMELSKVLDGFIVADTLVIKAQVQVIRERAHRPFRCLDCQYRRELVRVYLSNVEQICRRFVEERRCKLSKLIEDKVRWSSFRAFWLGVDQNARRRMSKDKADAILKVVVKHFFIEKEVTSTLVMDSLYSGLKALECQSKNKKGGADSVAAEDMPASIVNVEKDNFVLADDVLLLLERAALEPLPPKDDKGPQSQSQSQNRTKDGNSGEECNKDSIERDERRLTELGRRTVEIFVLAHIFSSRIEVAYQEAVALKRQEELIREEEAAGLLESELKAKRVAAEKEKRAKKKQAKQRRSSRKGKDRGRDEKSDVTVQGKRDFSVNQAESAIGKIDMLEDVSDVSDTGDDIAETIQLDLEERDAIPINWDTDTLEINPATVSSGIEIQNEQVEKKSPSIMDDSSSTCSTDSVPSVVMNGPYKGSSSMNKSLSSPSRGKGQHSKNTRDQTGHDMDSLPNGTTPGADLLRDATGRCRESGPESEADVLSLKDRIQLLEQNLAEKVEEVVTIQKQLSFKDQVDVDRPCKLRSAELSSVPTKDLRVSQQPKKTSENSTDSVRETTSNSTTRTEKSAPQVLSISKHEAQKSTTPTKVCTTQQGSSMSRPSSAPLIPGPRPPVLPVSTVQALPLFSRSVSATGRLGSDPSPSSQFHIPQSYRNAIMGKTAVGASTGTLPAHSSSGTSSHALAHSQASSSSFQSSSSDPLLQNSVRRPGFTFGSVNPEALHSRNLWTDNCSQQKPSRSVFNPSNITNDVTRVSISGGSHNMASYSDESPSSLQPPRQAQGVTPDEFPHLDIINYLLDEEQTIGKVASNGYHNHGLNRQYTFPGDDTRTDIGPANLSCLFDRPDQYHDRLQRMYGVSSGSFDGQRRDLIPPQVDLSVFTNGPINGMIQSQWPIHAADQPLLNLGSADANGYLYQCPDYSNLACGVNGYTMYWPTNGI